MKRTSSIHLVVLGCAASLTISCGATGALTCSEYAAQTFTEQTDTIQALLTERRLEPNDVGNTLGASAAVNAFCGTPGLGSTDATRNVDRPIEEAVDWDSPTW